MEKKCVFCGRTEKNFTNGNQWTIEHILPKAIVKNDNMILDKKFDEEEWNK